MPRNLTTTYINALLSPIIRPALFVQATFANETVYLWTGYGTITWNYQDWVGVGGLLNVSTIEEVATVEAKGISISLSGIDPDLLQECLLQFQISLPVYVYFGLFDENGNLLPSPVTSFAGRMDQPTIDLNTDTVTITIACESRLMDMNVPLPWRYDAITQAIFYPNDMSFSFVNSIQNVQLAWGQAATSTGNP
jgi:hypothetical protein